MSEATPTAPTPETPAETPADGLTVALPGSDLASWVHAYSVAQQLLAAAQERADLCKAQLKAVLGEQLERTGGTSASIYDPTSNARVTLQRRSSWRVDTTRLKAEQPALYAAFAKESTSYVLTLKAGD